VLAEEIVNILGSDKENRGEIYLDCMQCLKSAKSLKLSFYQMAQILCKKYYKKTKKLFKGVEI
jgi:hypothetical protein